MLVLVHLRGYSSSIVYPCHIVDVCRGEGEAGAKSLHEDAMVSSFLQYHILG